jgi:multisubunit Na+/H+ antiporter MnhC subunit
VVVDLLLLAMPELLAQAVQVVLEVLAHKAHHMPPLMAARAQEERHPQVILLEAVVVVLMLTPVVVLVALEVAVLVG